MSLPLLLILPLLRLTSGALVLLCSARRQSPRQEDWGGALGYAIWYDVLPQLGRTLAASVQLLVPPASRDALVG